MIQLQDDIGAVLEQNKALKSALRMGGHDVRGALLGIMFMADLSRAEPDPNERSRYCKEINHLCKQANELLDTYFKVVVSEHVVLHVSTIDLRALVQEELDHQWSLLGPEGQQKFEVRTHLEDIHLPADGPRLRQVVSNLLINAFGHCFGGGALEISLARLDGHIRFVLRDHGPGIAEDRIPTLFDLPSAPVTLRGLGLWVCKRIIEAHGGAIACHSTLGQGCYFRFTLPAGDGT